MPGFRMGGVLEQRCLGAGPSAEGTGAESRWSCACHAASLLLVTNLPPCPALSLPALPSALWVVTNETGVTWNHAYLHGMERLAHFWAGDNDRGAKLRPTNPLLALLEFDDTGKLVPLWKFAGYLPHDCQVRFRVGWGPQPN